MTNDLMASASNLFQDGRLDKGIRFKFDSGKWSDGDGLAPPEPLLVFGLAEGLRQWMTTEEDRRVPIDITTHPLPDVGKKNSEIPQSDWPIGLSGKPEPPWKHMYAVYLIDLATAQIYTALNSTLGMQRAWQNLNERITIMRALRNKLIMPMVTLTDAPWPTSFGMKRRPEFRPTGEWMSPPRPDGEGSLSGPATPQISGPTTPPENVPTVKPDAVMEHVEPASVAEEIDDRLPPWA